MPPAGFEPAVPASERPQTYALYPMATGLWEMHAGFMMYLDSCSLSFLQPTITFWMLDVGDVTSANIHVHEVLQF